MLDLIHRGGCIIKSANEHRFPALGSRTCCQTRERSMRTSLEASQNCSWPALVIAAVSSTLQLAHHVTASGLLSRKASEAGGSYSMAHFVTAAPARCSPSLKPPQPAKMSMVASARVLSMVASLPRAQGICRALALIHEHKCATIILKQHEFFSCRGESGQCTIEYIICTYTQQLRCRRALLEMPRRQNQRPSIAAKGFTPGLDGSAAGLALAILHSRLCSFALAALCMRL